MYESSWFSGIAGGTWGTKSLLGWKTVNYVEIDPYNQKLLQQRIHDGHLDQAPIWDDINTFPQSPHISQLQDMADELVITAGPPCQPYSISGQKAGKEDQRNLWPQTIASIKHIRPAFLLLENVRNLLCFDYFLEVLIDLHTSGYDSHWSVISAQELGASHIRQRLWLVAKRRDITWQPTVQPRIKSFQHPHNITELEKYGNVQSLLTIKQERSSVVPRFGSIGNSQVPLQTVSAWQRLAQPQQLGTLFGFYKNGQICHPQSTLFTHRAIERPIPPNGAMIDGDCYTSHSYPYHKIRTPALPTPRNRDGVGYYVLTRKMALNASRNHRNRLDKWMLHAILAYGYEKAWANPEFAELMMLMPIGWSSLTPLPQRQIDRWFQNYTLTNIPKTV